MNQSAVAAKVNTLSNVGLSRLSRRALRRLRYRWLYPRLARYVFPVPASLGRDTFDPSVCNVFHEALAATGSRASLLEQADTLCSRRFSCLNQPPVHLGTPIDWHVAQGKDPLWQYNLHYGEWALTLARAFLMTGEIRFRDTLMRFIGEWIDHQKVGDEPGWEPYPTSRRVVAWSRVGIAMPQDGPWQTFWRSRLAPSLWQQTQVLRANLERDLVNNHLMGNYRALAWMGLLFKGWSGAGSWCDIGLTGLWEQMRLQVLSDGVHDERSISYHTLVLQDLLETWWLTCQTGGAVPEDVEPTIVKMLHFLAETRTPDGCWPMVNDSVPDYPIDPTALLVAGALLFGKEEWRVPPERGDGSYHAWLTGRSVSDLQQRREDASPVAPFPQAGYVVLRDKIGDFLFFDAGPMGSERMQGHGHADALSFILYGRCRPLVIDPGVYSYHEKAWRDHFRSTGAHNTVTVDHQDQCLFWGPFRVAYPPKVRLLEWSQRRVLGEHEGYYRLQNPVLHRRSVERKAPGEWEVNDRFEGSGEHDLALSLQFSPGAKSDLSGLNGEVRWPEGVRLEVICPSPAAGAVAELERGWVSPGWNLKEEAPRYVLRWHARLPAEMRLILKIQG
jgi:uncharacterized heparinase superfamily protein